MNVSPSSPLLVSRGLCVRPLRGVTAECRTSRVKLLARFRKTGLFNEVFNIVRSAWRSAPPASPCGVNN